LLGVLVNSEKDDGVGGSGTEDGVIKEVDVIHIHYFELLYLSGSSNRINSESLSLSIESVTLLGHETVETLNGEVHVIAVLKL
jgi:hypothetical protein